MCACLRERDGQAWMYNKNGKAHIYLKYYGFTPSLLHFDMSVSVLFTFVLIASYIDSRILKCNELIKKKSDNKDKTVLISLLGC